MPPSGSIAPSPVPDPAHASRHHRRRQHQRHPCAGGAGDRGRERRGGLRRQRERVSTRWRRRHGARALRRLRALPGASAARYGDHRQPVGLHAEQGIAAARRGLHVLVEKPIDVTTARIDALLAAADRRGVKLGVMFSGSSAAGHPRHEGVRSTAGRLGKPVLASGRVKWYRPPEYYAGSRWRGTRALDGGGALMNQAIHTVDLLLWLFGPVRASTRARRRPARDRGRGHRRGGARVRERRARHHRGDDVGLPGLRAAGRADRLERDRHARRRRPRGGRSEGCARRRTAGARVGRTTVSAASPVVSDPAAHVRVIEDFIRRRGTPAAVLRWHGRAPQRRARSKRSTSRRGRSLPVEIHDVVPDAPP